MYIYFIHVLHFLKFFLWCNLYWNPDVLKYLTHAVKTNVKQCRLWHVWWISWISLLNCVFSLPASVRSTLKSPPASLSDSRLVPSASGTGNFSATMESSFTRLLLNLFGSNISIIEKEILWVDVVVTPQSLGSSILHRERPLKKGCKRKKKELPCVITRVERNFS